MAAGQEGRLMNLPDKKIDSALSAASDASAACPAPEASARSVEQLLHELQMHEVELEMQNEALRRAQMALEESRDRYLDLYEFAPVGYLSLTPDGQIEQINLTGAKLLQRARKDLLHKRFALIVIAPDQERWERLFLGVKGRNERATAELALTRGDGALFHAQLDCVSLKSRAGLDPASSSAERGGAGVSVALIDISERKQAERALFDSHETLCSILATTRDGYWHVDSQGVLIDVNAVYSQQSAYLRKELLGMPISELETPESAEQTEIHIKRIIKEGSGQFESTHRRKNGSVWQAEVSVTYRDSDGGEFFFFVRDISERKRADEVLREQKEFFHLIAENIGDFIAVLDREGRRLYNSPSYLQFFEASSDLRGTDSFAEIHPDDQERVKRVFMETVESGIGRQLAYRFLKADGSIRDMESRGSVIKDGQGRVTRVVVVSHDVTERKRAERALEESEAFKSIVLNSVAAEIAVIDRNGVIQAVNERWRLFSLENSLEPGQPVSRTEVGANYLDVCAADPLAADARDGIQAVIDGRLPSFGLEYHCHSAQQQRWFSMIVTPLGKDLQHGVTITHTDITALKQAEQYEQFRSRILELLADGKPLPVILEALVRGVEQIQPMMLCSILLLDSQGQRLCKGVAPSLPDFYNDAIDGLQIGVGVGSCGMAAYTGERVIVEDIATHPFWARYRELAASAGLGACWSQPIRATTGRVLGTFAIYHRQAHSPTSYDLSIIEQSARLASIAIERNVAAEKLRDSEAHYRLLTEDVSDVVWKQDCENRFTYISPADERLRGYRADEVIGRHIFEFMTAEGIAAASEKIRQRQESDRRGIPSGTSNIELQQRCKDGRLIWVEILSTPERDAQGRITGYHGISRDITERRQMEDQVRQLAFYDPLTKLPNRRLLKDRLILAMAASARNGLYAAMMFIDLDNFKPLNDSQGHEAGDLLLIEVATRMKGCVREMDTVARVGGDEFVVMISELDADKGESAVQARLIAEKIRLALAQPYRLSITREGSATVEHLCTACIGVVLFNNHEAHQDDIINWADMAMYEAKEAGRNRIRFYAAKA
jgi:diguanylate cyclase (GGDEF)-like protein/PAS domain S-box-containing protein